MNPSILERVKQQVGSTYTPLDIVVRPFFAFFALSGLLLFVSLDHLDEIAATQLYMQSEGH